MKRISFLITVFAAGIILTFEVNKNVFAKNEKGAATTDMSISKQSIESAMDKAYTNNKDVKEGKNADYIKELATVDPNIFGIALVTVDGQVYTKGDISSRVSIQSISKVFTLARIIEELGPQAIKDKIGVDATGLRFNSIVAIEEH